MFVAVELTTRGENWVIPYRLS